MVLEHEVCDSVVLIDANLKPISEMKFGIEAVKVTIPKMASYPTPPSSSGDSPIYCVASPNSNRFSIATPESSQQYLTSKIMRTDLDMQEMQNYSQVSGPRLRFIEQPTNKFRFRYKSEMAGTHGSLCGVSSDKARKQTYPTVELLNCPQKAVIRCSIYQYNVTEDFKPHPHRLIMKKGKTECDDPHDITVGPEEGYVATFHSMGIIHTARKNIVGELVRKKTLLKKEYIATIDGKMRELTHKELTEIKGLAEQESKSINLNIVCLRFDAYLVKDGIRNAICAPIYSHGINNLKCALTGELKIVRMDHCTSPARGGKEIFLLVERVTKKNIKIRFFELDDDDQEVWEGWGRFSELDVHHQYAIVFRTPTYDRDPNITRPVNVYMELVRPSDNAKSEWKEFRFVPNNEFKPGSKRQRSQCYSSSSSFNSSSLSSAEIPLTVPTAVQKFNLQNATAGRQTNSWSQNDLLTDEQLEIALTDIRSDEFSSLFEQFGRNIPMDIGTNAMDCSNKISDGAKQIRIDCSKFSQMHIGHATTYSRKANLKRTSPIKVPINGSTIKMEISPVDLQRAERTYNELKNFIKSTDASERAPEMLDHYLGDDREKRNNALHVFVALNRKEEVNLILKMLLASNKLELTNVPNVDSLTPLHIAVQCRNEEFIAYLLQCGANPLKPDNKGRTVLHTALQIGAPLALIDMLLLNPYKAKLLNMLDYDGRSPLTWAIETRNLTALKLLCQNGADVNQRHQKNGYTPLRIAVECQYVEGIIHLLASSRLNLDVQNDFQGLSPFDAAISNKSSPEVIEVVARFMNEQGTPINLKKEVDEDDDDEDIEEMEEDVEIKSETSTIDPEVLYSDIKSLSPRCMDEVATILDENGKYLHLANLLDLSHLIQAGIISSERSISRNLLQYAIEIDNVPILHIRNFLENLDEHIAVAIMDQEAQQSKSSH